MCHIKTFAFFLLHIFFCVTVFSQVKPTNLDESNTSAIGSSNTNDYVEMLDNYLKHPININEADRGSLDELKLLTPPQITAIILHRLKYGSFLSLLELQSVPGLNLETIKNILPYITVSENKFADKEKIQQLLKGAKHTIVLSYEQPMQTSQGFLNGNDSNNTNDYLGSNFKLNVRYRYTNGSKLSIGFNADKDLGEPFFNSNQPQGFDFYSAHLFVKELGVLKQLAVGDYHLSIGQGLGIGSGFVLNKSIEVLQIHRYASGLRPYRSMNEFGFFRGMAATIGSEKFSMICYTSIKKTDGNTVVTDTSLFASERYYNLIQSGYHRTARELALQNTSVQKIFGGYLQNQLKRFHAGLGYVYQQSATTQQVMHSDLTYTTSNYSFFAEGAVQQGGGRAFLAGTMACLNKDLDVAVIYRNYNAQYTNSLSNAFSNASSPTNENGIYTGITLKLNAGFRVLGYADFFTSPQAKYRTNGASYGHDYASALQYQPSKSFRLEVRYRIINNQVNVPASIDNTIGYLTSEQQSTLRFQCDYSNSKQWVLRTRFEQTRAQNETGEAQKGNLIFQDVHFNSLKGRWGADLRYCLFNSNGSSARMYTFENDVPYSFSIAQLSGIGSRFYIMTNYKFNRKTEAWLRYSNSFFPDETTIGSGLDKISGNQRESVKVLLKINF